jgi:hypothetical protein
MTLDDGTLTAVYADSGEAATEDEDPEEGVIKGEGTGDVGNDGWAVAGVVDGVGVRVEVGLMSGLTSGMGVVVRGVGEVRVEWVGMLMSGLTSGMGDSVVVRSEGEVRVEWVGMPMSTSLGEEGGEEEWTVDGWVLAMQWGGEDGDERAEWWV